MSHCETKVASKYWKVYENLITEFVSLNKNIKFRKYFMFIYGDTL